MADLGITCTCFDDTYLTPDEFAALPAGVQVAAWNAADCGLLGYTERTQGQPRRFHRAQVLALPGETAAAR